MLSIKIMKTLRLRFQFWLIERARIKNVKAFYEALSFAESIGMNSIQSMDYANQATREEQFYFSYLKNRYREAYLRHIW